ncbi:MAG: hypothetical protein KGI80_02955 [Verrucomicrobiota bacterium]|nr:hypothetical protein [Verrucomicrobiota bacterium]
MNIPHIFIFSPGQWLGEGKILLNLMDEELIFQTNWIVQQGDFAGRIACAQEIQIAGISDEMHNDLTFYDLRSNSFAVDLENPNVGKVVGKGVFDGQMVAWEFRNTDAEFEGYESYMLQPDGSYMMKAEYLTSDQLRTQIEARIWKHSEAQ